MASSKGIYGGTEDILSERRVSNDFRWATKSWNPSPCFYRGKLKDPKEIIQLVLASDNVQRAIQEVCAKEGRDEKDVQKEAQDILIEMGHDSHLYAVRWFGIMLSKISKRLYSSIQVNTDKFDKIKQALESYPVILLPTHRSYVDFLLMSYMFFHYNLPLPIIAAGMDFMGMVGIGEMLRKSGAFFIRRRFGGDVLYWALVKEYVKKCAMTGGHPVEMFVEGTRSRSGKAISPKIGLLSAMLELVWNAEVPDILILPISMSYDRTLEEKLYAHELLGQPKPKESTNGLVKALRWLTSQSYGSIYVNFGDLISVRQFFDRVKVLPITSENGLFSKTAQEIAIETILEHQKHLVVPIFPLVATVILSKISRGQNTLKFEELMYHINGLRAILASRNNQTGLPDSKESLENNVRHILHVHSSLVMINSQNNSELSAILEPSETVQFMQFQHYANQLLPLILPCCLVSVITQNSILLKKENLQTFNNDETEQDPITISAQLSQDYTLLREQLVEDFPYHRGSESIELTWAVNTLNSVLKHELGPLKKSINPETCTPHGLLEILRSACEPYLIAYYGVTRTLLEVTNRTKDPCEMKQFGKMCQDFIHQQLKTTSILPKQYGALSLETLSNASLSLVQSQTTAKVKLEDGSFGIVLRDSQRLSSIQNRLGKLLFADCPILNTKRHSVDPKVKIDSSQFQLRSKL